MIKGSPTDPNANFLRDGQQEVLDAAIKKGDIKIVGEEYTDGWKPEMAQKNMEQILTKNGGKVDAVVASNDGTAGGVVAALHRQGHQGHSGVGPGRRPRRAEPRGAGHADRVGLEGRARPGPRGRRRRGGAGRGQEGAGCRVVERRREEDRAATRSSSSRWPITKDNLDVVVKAGWIKKDDLCKGVDGRQGAGRLQVVATAPAG